MKKILLLAGVASIFALNANAFEFNPYMAARFKFAFMDNSVEANHVKETINKDLAGGSGALGVKIPVAGHAFRIEAEYTRTADAKKYFHSEDEKMRAKLRAQALMFNTYFDISTNTPFTPYLSAGLGGARTKFSADDQAIHQTELAWQVGAGVSYQINEHFAAEAGYRYISYGEFSDYLFDEDERINTKVESKASEIMFGVRYTF